MFKRVGPSWFFFYLPQFARFFRGENFKALSHAGYFYLVNIRTIRCLPQNTQRGLAYFMAYSIVSGMR